jgi:hypothetical protein
VDRIHSSQGGFAMMKELFSGPIGLMSLAVIIGVVVIGAYMYKFVKDRMAEDEAAAKGK